MATCIAFNTFKMGESIIANPLGTISEVKQYFEKNLTLVSEEYEKQFNHSWNPGKVKNVTNIFEIEGNLQCGYLVSFDVGYLAYSNEMSIYLCDISTELTNHSSYWKMNEQIGYIEVDEFVPLSDNNNNKHEINGSSLEDSFFKVGEVTKLNNFTLTECLSPIKYLVENYQIDYRNYVPLCTEQFFNDCAGCAFANLLYGYKLTGWADLTYGYNPAKLNEIFFNMAGAKKTEGVETSKIKSTIDRYLLAVCGNEWKFVVGSKDGYPAYCRYSRDGEGHAAIRIGNGKSDYWWIFKSYWQIVISWHCNYKNVNGTYEWLNNDVGIYVIDGQYCTNSWSLIPNE